MNNVTRIRNLIGDEYSSTSILFVGNGTTTIYELGRQGVKTNSIQLTGLTGITITSIDYESGVVTLSSAPANGAKFNLTFKYSAFRDEEIEQYLQSNTVKGAALELIQVLMASAARRYDYSTGLEEFSPSQMFDHLERLKKSLKDDDVDLSSSGGAKVANRTTDYGNLRTTWEEPKRRTNSNTIYQGGAWGD